jgi:cyclopropane fatty-acyl-phospholipid synthase-like methyltransferase
VVAEVLKGRQVRRLLDIGCGGGSLVVDACLQDPELTAIGLDESPGAIAEARALAERAGVADRIEFVVADAFAPQTWPDNCRTADAVCAFSVMHELFRDGEQRVVEVLDGYLDQLGTARFLLIGEPELWGDGLDNDDDFFLIHVLTGQGMPRARSGWLSVFEQSQWECRTVYSRPGAGPRMCFYDLVLPVHAGPGRDGTE